MLVISRYVDGRVVCQDQDGNTILEVVLLRIEGTKVRLGFVASPDIKILRSELLTKDAFGTLPGG